MGKYSSEGNTSQLINIFLKNNNTVLLQSFEENSDSDSLNADLIFDKDFNIIKFFVKELGVDIKNCLNKEQIEYYANCFKSGEAVLEENLLIEFSVDGYFFPGKTYGPPEDCYPDESDEERTVTGCFIKLSEKNLISLPVSCFDKIYDFFSKKINSVDVPVNEDNYPEDDYEDDYHDDYYC